VSAAQQLRSTSQLRGDSNKRSISLQSDPPKVGRLRSGLCQRVIFANILSVLIFSLLPSFEHTNEGFMA
jgi:hypothetical protein